MEQNCSINMDGNVTNVAPVEEGKMEELFEEGKKLNLLQRISVLL